MNTPHRSKPDMTAQASRRGPQLRRRQLLGLAASLLAAAGLPRARAATSAYPETVAAMQQAAQRETRTYRQYREFGRQAKAEGYVGIAYLFVAFAASEMIHGQNFQRVLARLGVELEPEPAADVPQGTTKENLIRAVGSEADDVDSFYPGTLARIKPEGYPDALTYVSYAWESEKQHRDLIRRIQRYSPAFFEIVAKTIDAKTRSFYVCQICGSTLNHIPADRCPVCKYPPEHYRLVEPPA